AARRIGNLIGIEHRHREIDRAGNALHLDLARFAHVNDQDLYMRQSARHVFGIKIAYVTHVTASSAPSAALNSTSAACRLAIIAAGWGASDRGLSTHLHPHPR